MLLLVGDAGEDLSRLVDIPALNLGGIHDEIQLAKAYSAADLFLFPTRADTFGLVAQEAIACGTPVVAFRVGGVSDLVRPDITGYLAEPGNADDFRRGIMHLLGDDARRNQMGNHSRAIALEEYSLERYRQEYLSLYRKLTTNDGTGTSTGASSTEHRPQKIYAGS